MTDNPLADGLLDLFYEIALETGEAAMLHYGSQLKVEYKDDSSPLTLADKLLDSMIYQKLSTAFPEIPIISEERSHEHPDQAMKGKFFLVDPIDGTKEFILKRDNFTINVALIDDGKPIAGLLHAPALGRLFLGDVTAKICLEHFIPKDAGNRLYKTQAIRHDVSDKPSEPDYILLTSQSHLSEKDQQFITLNQIKTHEINRIGSSIKFALIAAGEAKIYPRFNRTMEWDVAAGQAIIESAGGTVVDFEGKALDYGKIGLENGNFFASMASSKPFEGFKFP